MRFRLARLFLLTALLLSASLSCPGQGLRAHSEYIASPGGRMRVKVLQPRSQDAPVPGILWIHGGGYETGGLYMLPVSNGKMLAKRFGAVVVSPAYRLSGEAPYPAALEDCYAALEWMYRHAEELGIDPERIVVGGESAGGGLTAAVCLLARDRGEIPVALQLPLYPMLDSEDTPSSADNHGRNWDTRRNHRAWKRYLGVLYGTDLVSKYASPARETDYAGLPPCYTYVTEGEPFLDETLGFVSRLQEAGVEARVDVYPGDLHAFDLLEPWRDESRLAKERLCEVFSRWLAGESFAPRVDYSGEN